MERDLEQCTASSWAWFYCWHQQILYSSSTTKPSVCYFEMQSLHLKRSWWQDTGHRPSPWPHLCTPHIWHAHLTNTSVLLMRHPGTWQFIFWKQVFQHKHSNELGKICKKKKIHLSLSWGIKSCGLFVMCVWKWAEVIRKRNTSSTKCHLMLKSCYANLETKYPHLKKNSNQYNFCSRLIKYFQRLGMGW